MEKNGKSGEISRSRVCYQRGLTRLVFFRHAPYWLLSMCVHCSPDCEVQTPYFPPWWYSGQCVLAEAVTRQICHVIELVAQLPEVYWYLLLLPLYFHGMNSRVTLSWGGFFFNKTMIGTALWPGFAMPRNLLHYKTNNFYIYINWLP